MAFFQFGTGQILLNPVGGNQAANPTPYLISTIQDFTFDYSGDLKDLRGQYQAPDDVAPGDKKFTGKFTYGANNVDFENNVLFADTRSAGITQIQVNEAGTVPATSTYVVTVTNSAHFATDLGVKYA